jgi:ribosomal protein L7/L12
MTLSSAQSPAADMTKAIRRPAVLPEPAVAALWRGNVIEAIKLVRLEKNIDLKEAKDQVDEYLRSQPVLKNKVQQVQAEAREGLFRWLIFLLGGGSALAYFLT